MRGWHINQVRPQNTRAGYEGESMKIGVSVVAIMLGIASLPVMADIVVPMSLVDEKGVASSAGQVTITESAYGLVLTPALAGLAPGLHGFHVHQNPDCIPGEKDGKKA